MTKRSTAKKERDVQAALVCGEAYQRLAEKFIPMIGTIKEESFQDMSNEVGNLVACATNLGFAIELYLKAILSQLDLQVPFEHDLRSLYDRIPQPVRDIIVGVYDEALPDEVRQLHGRVSFTLAIGPAERPAWNDNTKESLALPDVLARSRNLFESWRYIFELSLPENSKYQFYKFEYVPLRCAAEAMRVEIRIRLYGEKGEA